MMKIQEDLYKYNQLPDMLKPYQFHYMNISQVQNLQKNKKELLKNHYILLNMHLDIINKLQLKEH